MPQGAWDPEILQFSNVPIHATLLPNGKVLYWGRRTIFNDTAISLHEPRKTMAYLWDPVKKTSVPTQNQPPRFSIPRQQGSPDGTPEAANEKEVNLFCSGHSMLPNGNLLVAGGHWVDGWGINSTCVYDWRKDTWEAKPFMNAGRWYPSVLTLHDGSALVVEGEKYGGGGHNTESQIWSDNKPWVDVTANPAKLDNYPRLHLNPKRPGVFYAGPQAYSWFLDTANPNPASLLETTGPWTPLPSGRKAGFRDHAPSVAYAAGQAIYIGGGTQGNNEAPTTQVEIIDLTVESPKWTTASPMNFPRTQHNATVLPDGTVLVTGGTRGTGFNNVRDGNPVHEAELWTPPDPKAKPPAPDTWEVMPPEKFDRCYHSIALLLPDGKVLTAGGGEWNPQQPPYSGKVEKDGPNLMKDTLLNGQLFKPPYLLTGTAAPIIQSVVPSDKVMKSGSEFVLTVAVAADNSHKIAKASLMRLGSVTHCCNMGQSLVWLDAKQSADFKTVRVTPPSNGLVSPPGWYLLFLVNTKGVPSKGEFIQFQPAPYVAPPQPAPPKPLARMARMGQYIGLTTSQLHDKIATEQNRPPVVIGLTSACPYGFAPCWGGAFEALHEIKDIDIVHPTPNHENSLVYVYTKEDIVPDEEKWQQEFRGTANATYGWRGIELTVLGTVSKSKLGADEQLVLEGNSTRSKLVLLPFQETDQIDWDSGKQALRPVTDVEKAAYSQLSTTLADRPGGASVQVTGRLQKQSTQFSLHVRSFKMEGDGGS